MQQHPRQSGAVSFTTPNTALSGSGTIPTRSWLVSCLQPGALSTAASGLSPLQGETGVQSVQGQSLLALTARVKMPCHLLRP